MKPLRYYTSPLMGANIEFFIVSSKNGDIIELDEVNDCQFTIDKSQVKLTPDAFSCRHNCVDDYIGLFDELSEVLSKKEATISLDRSACGFIRLEVDEDCIDDDGEEEWLYKCITKYPNLVVKLLDLLVGNTHVMLAKDRAIYGKAGEHELFDYGIEYKVPSNFWLKSYQLMAMTYGFGRLALSIVYNIYCDEIIDGIKKSVYRELLEVSNENNVQKAINDNNFDLAVRNWNEIKDILVSMIPNRGFGHYPICVDYLNAFEYFISKGLDYWFKDDILTHWTKSLVTYYAVGWENFLSKVVSKDIATKGKMKWKITNKGFEFST